MSARSTKFEIRLTESEKARWQGEADEQQTTVSELVRARMNDTGTVAVGPPVQAPVALAPKQPESARDPVDLDSEEPRPLRGWLDLADSDGDVDYEQLAEWKAFAAESGVSFPELLQRVVLYVNVAHV